MEVFEYTDSIVVKVEESEQNFVKLNNMRKYLYTAVEGAAFARGLFVTNHTLMSDEQVMIILSLLVLRADTPAGILATMNLEGPILVRASDLVYDTDIDIVVDPDTILFRLAANESINASFETMRGTGAEHSRYLPVSAACVFYAVEDDIISALSLSKDKDKYICFKIETLGGYSNKELLDMALSNV